jgi:hypothetical protein
LFSTLATLTFMPAMLALWVAGRRVPRGEPEPAA